MMKYRVQVAKRATDESATFGKSGQPKYEILGTFWMGETFNKGVKAMREGALDAYDSVIFRMNFSANVTITRESLIECDGKVYQVQSLNSDKRENKIIIRATEMTTQVNIVDNPEPEPSISDI